MDTRFAAHNSHHEDPSKFAEYDPQLRNLKKHLYVFNSGLIRQIPINSPGVYSISGGRQIGKTTMLKQWMEWLIQQNIDSKNIIYIAGEIIDDHHILLNIIHSILRESNDQTLCYLIIDEITYIKDWDKAVKYLADSGALSNTLLIITGSDLAMMKEARVGFPGRREDNAQVDFHLFPLSFYEYIKLKLPDIDIYNDHQLGYEFQNYLIHGGYITAINDFHKNGKIGEGTYNTYSDWIRRDMIKHGKSEHYLKEVLTSFLSSYGSQITWNYLSRHTSIGHTATGQSYAEFLSFMDVIFVQHAIIEDKLIAAPKKAKKIYFADIFILHSIKKWLEKGEQQNTEISISLFVKTAVVNHYRRWFPTYYIKGSVGEVDVAYVADNKFYPIEVKWTNQMQMRDLRQIAKYNNPLVLAKNQTGSLSNIRFKLLPKYLFNLGEENKNSYKLINLDL